MFKRKKIVVGIIVVVVAVLSVSYMFQNSRNKKWFNSHHFIYEIENEEAYSIKRITNKRLNYHFGDEFAAEPTKLDDRIDGYIFYDTLQHTFWVETTWYNFVKEGSSPETETEWLNMDAQGNVIDKKTRIDSAAAKGFVILKTETANFYDWKDPAKAFHVDHFARERFNWESLNPLRNYGSPTGGKRATYWEGVAYLKLQMEKSTIQFKTKSSTTDRGYAFRIDLYRVPQRYQSGSELAFLYIDEYFLNFEDKGLYMIMEK